MAYIGRTPHSGSYEKQLITGDSSTTTFSLDFSVGNNASLIVSTNGTILEPDVGYSLSGGGSSIVFNSAPQTGHRTYVVFLGIARDVDHLESVGIITTKTELAEVAAADDLLLLFDTSAGALRKIKRSNVAEVVADVTPQLGGMLDVNGQAIGDGTLELIKFTETASAVNEITVTNAATSNGPEISATGGDTNIDLKLTPKATGKLVLDGLSFPNADGSANQFLKTDGSGVLSFADVPTPTLPTVANVSQTIIPATPTAINITGTNFVAIPKVEFINASTGVYTSPNTTSQTNTSTLAVNVTLASGNYFVRVENPDGNAARSTNNIITASTAPTFSTSAGSLGTFAGNFSGTLATISASSDSTIAFAETTSVLAGAGVTLNTSTGALTTSDFGGSSVVATTYTFTLRITDAESQTATREFSMTSSFGATGGAQFNP
jgi:hypothetical protein